MYTNVIALLVFAIILTILVTAYLNIVSIAHSYYLCKIAKITIREQGNMLYVASNRPAIIHVFLISGNTIKHIVCYGECQIPKAPLVVAISDFDIAWRGDPNIVGRTIYLSPCGVTTYRPSCLPWIELPDAKMSMLRKLPLCNCNYRTVISGGVLGVCKTR